MEGVERKRTKGKRKGEDATPLERKGGWRKVGDGERTRVKLKHEGGEEETRAPGGRCERREKGSDG